MRALLDEHGDSRGRRWRSWATTWPTCRCCAGSGCPIAVANAVPEVKAVAAYVTGAAGGHGAVREVVEALLKARGEWDAAVERYLSNRDGA